MTATKSAIKDAVWFAQTCTEIEHPQQADQAQIHLRELVNAAITASKQVAHYDSQLDYYEADLAAEDATRYWSLADGLRGQLWRYQRDHALALVEQDHPMEVTC